MLKLAIVAGALAWSACVGDAAAQTAGRIVPKLATQADPNQQYSLYLPPHYDPARRWPVLILLDPRGRGEQTLEMARAGAAEHGWILISSWQSRSDDEESITIDALQALLKETGEHYPYDPKRLYLAGMSGTSKTLWVVEAQMNGLIAGMIGAAGGRPPELGKFHRSLPRFVGITANHDFNYQEMFELDAALGKQGATRRLDVFDGGHGWPDAAGFRQAMDWMELMAMRDGLARRREDWIDAQQANARKALEAEQDPAKRWRRLDQFVRDFDGLRDVAAERAEANALSADPRTRELLALEKRLASEEKRQARNVDDWVARYNQRMVEGRRQPPPDVGRSLKELHVARLQQQAQDPDARIADSATRQLQSVYAATASYLPRAQEQAGDIERARAALKMAVRIYPERPSAHCRLARIEARRNARDDAYAELDRCLQLGGREQVALRTDPDWEPLRDDRRWPGMLERAEAVSPP